MTRIYSSMLRHALPHEEQPDDDCDRQQHVKRAAREIDPEIADAFGLAPREAAVPSACPRASGLSLAGVRSVIPDRAMGLPVLRALSLCTCCRHYPGAATGALFAHSSPGVSAFPERVVGSACASSVSRLARRSLALRPAHSRCHQFVTRYPKASAISLP